ncbi:MAG: hypothetical protein QW728_06415 [Thermoplasmata archaeon]
MINLSLKYPCPNCKHNLADMFDKNNYLNTFTYKKLDTIRCYKCRLVYRIGVSGMLKSSLFAVLSGVFFIIFFIILYVIVDSTVLQAVH